MVVIKILSFCDTCDKVFDHRPQSVLWSTVRERARVVTFAARWNVAGASILRMSPSGAGLRPCQFGQELVGQFLTPFGLTESGGHALNLGPRGCAKRPG